jgi:outer membrane lipoprotein-sorting protein
MSSPRAPRALALACSLILGSGVAASPQARAADAGSISEVADCAIRNLPPAAHAHAHVVARSAKGKDRAFEVEYWSRTAPEGTRQIVIVDPNAPESTTSAYLFSDGNSIGEAWAYSAKAGKATKIESRGPKARLFGTNLSLEDFARFARVVFPGQVRRLADTEIDGRKAYVIETKPSPDSGSEYSKIVTSIDKEWCVILRRESYDASFAKGAKPRKVYRVAPADVRVDGNFANGSRGRQDDAKDGSTTEMQILSLELPTQLDESLFTPDALPRAGH